MSPEAFKMRNVLAAVLLLSASVALAQPAAAADHVFLCHASGTAASPYGPKLIAVSDPSPHLGHGGPVFDTSMHDGDGWGDIIPPSPAFPLGLNWDAAGQAIWNNDCQVPFFTFATGPRATITGTARQGQIMTAHGGSPDPTPDSFAYKWFADGSEISGATDGTFTLTSAQVGTKITVEVTAKKAGYNDASDTSDPTATVTGIFDPGPTATISGTARVGQVLNAHPGSPSPTPDKTSYRWYANGIQIKDKTASHLTLASAQAGKKITVKIYVAKTGYLTVSDVSSPTGVVSGLLAKRLTLIPDEDTVRVGQTVAPVKISGLASKENWTLYFDGHTLKSGNADANGKVKTSYIVPSVPKGKHVLKVTGRFSDRYDTDTLTVK